MKLRNSKTAHRRASAVAEFAQNSASVQVSLNSRESGYTRMELLEPFPSGLKSDTCCFPWRLVFCFLAAVAPALGSDQVPVTAIPIVRTSQLPPATVEEEIDAPKGRYRGLKSFGKTRVDANPESGPLPEDRSAGFFPDETVQLTEMRAVRDWPATEYHWQASDFYHQPLYFDHPSLEVCGRSAGKQLQPLLSGTRFFLTIPLLPVKIVENPPRVHIWTLGLCRPGSPTPLPPASEGDCCDCSSH